MNYEEAKKIFLEIKSQIDETINKNGINKVLLNYDDKLTDWYNKVISLCSNDEDKKYINFKLKIISTLQLIYKKRITSHQRKKLFTSNKIKKYNEILIP